VEGLVVGTSLLQLVRRRDVKYRGLLSPGLSVGANPVCRTGGEHGNDSFEFNELDRLLDCCCRQKGCYRSEVLEVLICLLYVYVRVGVVVVVSFGTRPPLPPPSCVPTISFRLELSNQDSRHTYGRENAHPS